jgi:hypothetical protein
MDGSTHGGVNAGGPVKRILPVVLLLALTACSGNRPRPVLNYHEYSVTFAAVKVPDSAFQGLGLSSYEDTIRTAEACQKLADHVAGHPKEFSITTVNGNALPIVGTHGRTGIRLLLDPKQEKRDFEAYGMMAQKFDPAVRIQEEDDRGYVSCAWECAYGVHLKQPIGNSTDVGGSGGCGGAMTAVGKPEIMPLFHADGVSLWLLGQLNRL